MTHANDPSFRLHPDEDDLVRAVDASAALRHLLAAASAPPSTAELKGHSRAIAAYRATRPPGEHEPEPGTGSTSRVPGGHRVRARFTGAGRWSAARLTAACTALLVLFGSAAGVAWAGELPEALQDAVSSLVNGRSSPGDSPAPTATPERSLPRLPGPSAAVTGGSRPSGSFGGSSASTGRPPADAAPRLAGLCRAYRAHQVDGSSERILARPGFAALVAAAGGVSAVTAFCAETDGSVPPLTSRRPLASEPTASRRPAASEPTQRTSLATDKPATDKPATDKPATDKPAGQAPAPSGGEAHPRLTGLAAGPAARSSAGSAPRRQVASHPAAAHRGG
jgi:hypothetical protein